MTPLRRHLQTINRVVTNGWAGWTQPSPKTLSCFVPHPKLFLGYAHLDYVFLIKHFAAHLLLCLWCWPYKPYLCGIILLCNKDRVPPECTSQRLRQIFAVGALRGIINARSRKNKGRYEPLSRSSFSVIVWYSDDFFSRYPLICVTLSVQTGTNYSS